MILLKIQLAFGLGRGGNVPSGSRHTPKPKHNPICAWVTSARHIALVQRYTTNFKLHSRDTSLTRKKRVFLFLYHNVFLLRIMTFTLQQ